MLDAPIVRVDDEHAPVGPDCQTNRLAELRRPGPLCPERRDEAPFGIELLNALVACIDDVHSTGAVYRDRARPPEAGLATPLEQETTVRVELLNALVPGVCDIDVALRVDGYPHRLLELRVPGPFGPPRCQRLAGPAELLDAVIE